MSTSERSERFTVLLDAHAVRLRAFAFSLVPNATDADDVMQQAHLTLWKKFDDFGDGTNFMAWAGRVVFLEAQQQRRRQGRDKLKFGDAFYEVVARLTTDQGLSDEMGGRERALRDCVAKLSPKHQDVVRLRYGEGLRPVQMGPICNRTAVAIRNTLSRIRRTLQICVERQVNRDARWQMTPTSSTTASSPTGATRR